MELPPWDFSLLIMELPIMGLFIMALFRYALYFPEKTRFLYKIVVKLLCKANFVLQAALTKMRKNMVLASNADEFYLLNASQLFRCFERNEAHNELEFLQTVLRWLDKYPLLDSADTLLKKIRPGLLTIQDLSRIYVPLPLQRMLDLVKFYFYFV